MLIVSIPDNASLLDYWSKSNFELCCWNSTIETSQSTSGKITNREFWSSRTRVLHTFFTIRISTMISLLLPVLIITIVQVSSFSPSSTIGRRRRYISQSIKGPWLLQRWLGVSNMDTRTDGSVPNTMHSTSTLSSTSNITPTDLPTSMAISDTIQVSSSKQTVQPQKAYSEFFEPSVQRWKRRLDTHEDPFNVHKWAGLGWLLSSTAIVTSGVLHGFQEVPAMLEPITYLFVLSTIAQSVTSIPMAMKHRAHEPAVQRGFISSAISATSTALTGFWLGPYGDHNYFGTHLLNLPDIGLVLVALIMMGDSMYNLKSFGDLKEIMTRITDMDPINDSQAIIDNMSASIATFPIGLHMNVAMLQQLYVHATDARVDFLDIFVSRGSSSDLVFYASMMTSIAICIGNLTVTLHHRKLISDRVNNLAIICSTMTSIIVNIIAAGVNL